MQGRQIRKRHSIKWTLLASEFIALQEPITCHLRKNNSSVITSSWSTLPICHCRRANPSLGTVLIINVGNFSGVEIKKFILNFRNWTGKSSCFQSSSVFERQTVSRKCWQSLKLWVCSFRRIQKQPRPQGAFSWLRRGYPTAPPPKPGKSALGTKLIQKRIFDPRFAGFCGGKEREIRNWICNLANLSQMHAICMTASQGNGSFCTVWQIKRLYGAEFCSRRNE